MTLQRQRIDVRGVPIAWEEEGDGPPVVLVHGIPTGPALWRHVVPRLAGVRTRAFEMVGYADSIPAGRQRDISVGRQADYLLAWLEALDVERAVLVGHDLGGGVVHIAAVREPARCAGLVLANAVGYDSWPIPSVKALRATSGAFRRLPNGAVKPIVATLMARGHDQAVIARESLDVHWRPYALHGAAAALARQVRALDVRDTLAVADRLRELRVPARIVWGAADQFQKIAYGERFAFDLRAPLDRIEGGKHFVPEDHADAVAEAITAVVSATS